MIYYKHFSLDFSYSDLDFKYLICNISLSRYVKTSYYSKKSCRWMEQTHRKPKECSNSLCNISIFN